MSDWELVDNESASDGDWEVESQSKESIPQPSSRNPIDQLGHELLSSVFKGVKGAIPAAKSFVTETVPSAAEYIYDKPASAIGSGVVGAVEGLEKGLSLPWMLARKLAETTTGRTDTFAHRARSPYETLLKNEQRWGIEAKSPQEEALRSISQLAGPLKAAPSTLGRAASVGAIEGGGGGDPIEAAIEALLLEKGGKKVGEISRKTYEGAKKIPSQMERAKTAMSTALSDKAERPSRGLSPESLSRFNEMEESQSKSIGEKLAPGVEHDVQLSETHLKPFIDNIHGELREGYKALERDAKADKSVIKRDSGKAILDSMAELRDLIKAGGLESKELKQLTDKISELHRQPNEMSVADALSSIRTLKTLASNERKKAFAISDKLTHEERKSSQNRASEIDGQIQKLSKMLEDASPADYQGRLKDLNNRYAKTWVPLRNNALVKQIRYQGRINPKDIPHALRGNEPANKLLRDAILSNPEASRLAVARKFSSKPDALHKSEAVHQPYIKAVPGLEEALKKQLEIQGERAKEEKAAEELYENNKQQQSNLKAQQSLLKKVVRLSGKGAKAYGVMELFRHFL